MIVDFVGFINIQLRIYDTGLTWFLYHNHEMINKNRQ